MTNLEIKSVVTASSWKYKFAEESEGLDSSPESDIDLKVEGQGDETTCINRTRSEKQNSLCLSFDEASITLHHGRAVRISFDAQWFEPADMSELRIFAIATMNQLVSKIGRPT